MNRSDVNSNQLTWTLISVHKFKLTQALIHYFIEMIQINLNLSKGLCLAMMLLK